MTKFVTIDDMKKLKLELGEMIKAAFQYAPQAARKPVRVVINICGNATTEVVSSEENAGAEEDGPPGDDDPAGNEDPSVPAAVLAAVPAAVPDLPGRASMWLPEQGSAGLHNLSFPRPYPYP